MLFVSLVPLVAIATRDTIQTQQALTKGAEISLRAGAEQTANSLDNFIQKTLDSVGAEAELADLVNFLTISQAARTGTVVRERTLNLLLNLGKKDKDNIISYALVDSNGNVVLDSATDVQYNESEKPYFQQVQFSDKPIVTYVTYEEKDNTTSLTFASPVVNADGDYIGVLRVKFKSAVLQDVIVNNVGTSSDVSVILLDQFNIRMADSGNPEFIQKSIVPLNPVDYANAVNNRRFLDTSPEEQATNFTDFKLGIDNAGYQPFFRADTTPNIAGDDTIAVAFLKTQPWIVAYSRPTSIFLADVQRQIRVNIVLIIVVSILIAIIATILARNLARPIISLTKTANAISQGDLSARSKINTRDEIGLLANTFNTMSAQIQELVTSLEQRVEQRTAELVQRSTELAEATKQSQKRADELQAIAEIARYISTEKQLERLLPLVAQAVSERFGFYHVGIFLLSENGKFAILRAANSAGGKKMLERQHKLEVGQVGIVGYVTSTGKPRIALDTGADSVYFNNPDLPETHSEMALPLSVRGSIIGALDVQSVTPNAFTDEDAGILGLLADQLAIAIDNVRLLEDAQNALAESRIAFREYLSEAWQNKSASKIRGYYQTLSGGQLVTNKTEAIGETFKDKDAKALAVPIQLHSQDIGTIYIRPNNKKGFDKDEINIIESVAERLGLALDNARLFEETSTRAERERLVTDITTKIRTTNDPQEMIQTAVDELKRALGVTQVEIVPQKISPPDN
ncbi:MAG: GAF domain-containing protein [Anaerolineales bacterium]|nr:GAF domain-containing protein [Anaerolineales bacterium]